MQEEKDYDKYFPMLAGGSDFNNFQKLRSLPEAIRDILTSDKIVDFIYGASQRYQLNDQQIEEFSRTVRQYFFNEIVEGEFARKISELCKISNEEALKILHSIKNIRPVETEKRNIVTDKIISSNNSPISISSKNNSIQANTVQMPVVKAMKLYPKLEKQIITSRPIIAKPFLKPIKPTLKNWLTVYEELMGAGKKSAIDRGNFLFHSEATKGLPVEERQKLAKIFNSVDENSNLTIEPIAGKIIFPKFKPVKKVSRSKISNQPTTGNSQLNNSGQVNSTATPITSPTPPETIKEAYQQNAEEKVDLTQGVGGKMTVGETKNEGGIGSDTFASTKNNLNSANSLGLPDEDNLSFSSNHTLPTESKKPTKKFSISPIQH
jgi:hypothetical protein